MSRLKRLIVGVDHRSLFQALPLRMQLEATMRSSASIVVVLICGSLLLGACVSERGPAESTATRYKVEVLEHGIDPQIIPRRFAADFDEDGQVDQLTVTDTSLHILLSGGGEFNYAAGEAWRQSGNRISDIRIFSFNRDGSYPSIVLATRHFEPRWWGQSAIQEVILNDHGILGRRRLRQYAVTAASVDCAWIKSNDLPVCFYATYRVEDLYWGLSGLIEIDVNGWRHLLADSLGRAHAYHTVARREAYLRRLANDSTYLALARRHLGLNEGAGAWEMTGYLMDRQPLMSRQTFDRLLALNVLPRAASTADTFAAVILAFLEQSTPREFVWNPWDMDAQEYDSILTAWGVEDSAPVVDVLRALSGAEQEKDQWIYSRSITRQYRLSWPEEWPVTPLGSIDGLYMMGVQFFDFSGDGLLDLVAVGEHSRIYSAIQNVDGYFVDGGYHSFSDEFVGAWAASVQAGYSLTAPPCVYLVLEKRETGRPSDYLECYDRGARAWYEVTLPEDSYFMHTAQSGERGLSIEGLSQRHHVTFWDMNEDGMIDFAARKEDGTWTAFTFVPE